MSEPKIADTRPMLSELAPGTYWWCSCGHSENQPFCDGSHHGTGLEPVMFEVDEAGKAAMCLCKRTGDSPYCDGSHSKL
jgi:CDGSH-type Zn-finger protein